MISRYSPREEDHAVGDDGLVEESGRPGGLVGENGGLKGHAAGVDVTDL